MKSVKKWQRAGWILIFGLSVYGCGSDSQEPVPGTGNADTVDGYHASNVPTPNTLLALDEEGKLPADITGDANTLDGYDSTDFLFRFIYDKDGDGKIDKDTIDSISWSSITNMPAGFADGIDDVGGDMFRAIYDTDDDGVVDTAESIPWTSITGMPAGFADGIDDDTTYSAGTGLTLVDTTFSVDQSILDAWYVNEDQPDSISSLMIINGTIVNDDISSTANIDPSKIEGTAWTSLNDGAGSGLDADLLDGHDSSYYLDISATDQTKEGGLQVNFLSIDSSSITIDSNSIDMQFTDNAGSAVYTLSQLAGWHGFSTRIKILLGDFTSTETGNTVALSSNGSYVWNRANAAADFIATYNIPNGFRATEVMVYGNNTRPLTVYECLIDTNTCTQVSTGCSVGSLCDITDVNSTDTNYLTVFIDVDAVSYQIYGGYITISRY